MTTSETLRAVDDALAGGGPDSADPDLRELQEIALVLQADAPAPDPAFVSGLDQRVARRFERPARPRRLPHRRAILAAAASVVALVAVIGALAGVLRSGGTARTRPAAETTAPVAKPLPAPKRSVPAGTIPLSADTAATARRVERDAQLTLAAPAGKLDDVANGIVQVTDRHRGVVLDSSLSTGTGSARGGSFELRVPSAELGQTLRDLSGLAEVRSRT